MQENKYIYQHTFNLPLGIGDKVWSANDSNHAWRVTRIDIHENTIVFRLGNVGTDNYSAFHLHELGERYFTSQHEARAAETKWREEMGLLPISTDKQCSKCGKFYPPKVISNDGSGICVNCMIAEISSRRMEMPLAPSQLL